MDMEAEGKTLETSATPFHRINNGEGHTDHTPKVSDYEKSREERIKENLQRMQKLGLVDLSLQVKSFVAPKRAPKKSPNRRTPRPPPLSLSEPPRRSSRYFSLFGCQYEMVLLRNRKDRRENIQLDFSVPEKHGYCALEGLYCF